MNRPLTIDDVKALARSRVPKLFFDYVDSGAYTEGTYRANEADFAAIHFRQRVMRDISARSQASIMMGAPVTMPVAIAPTGSCGMHWPDGEMRVAEAAEAFGIPFTLSTMSICSIEDVASVRTKPFWFQLYVMTDRDFVQSLIDRAKAAKCSALVLTVDLQIVGQRHKDIRNDLSSPPKLTLKHLVQMAARPGWCMRMAGTPRHTFRNVYGHAKGVNDLATLNAWVNEQFDERLQWSDVEWIKERWGGPLIVKGILDSDDAKAAVDHGADAVIVSNHGGRQLDGARSSISMLPRIVDAVGPHVEVHLDGGIRSGQDVLRALALGARGVYIGRPYLYGLGWAGRAGVMSVLDIIKREMDITMGLCGITQCDQIDQSILESCN
ncbi:alpha-hydroxy acid oxidase [Mesorhizobium sp. M0047]|uniref:alpha-hydroxy acid oxidase n=1 Tax=Mesorhizobium sp. M0047 TaxID=2956859 RepID=UPI00333AFF72